MKKKTIIIAIVTTLVVGLVATGWMMRNQSTTSSRQLSAASRQLPAGLYENKIKNISTISGMSIESMLVENNVDSNAKPVGDHIELRLVNTTDSTIQGLESYITMTNAKTSVKEGYYVPLAGLTIAPHQTTTVHYNGGSGANHFSLTENSLFYTSNDSSSISVEVSAPGYAAQTKMVVKAAGGAETKD